MRTRTRLLLAPALALPLLLVACGDDDGGSSSAPPADPDLTVKAVPGLKFDSPAYTLTSGQATMLFSNEDTSGQSHDAVIYTAVEPDKGLDSKKGESVGGVEKITASGKKVGADLDLGPGAYLVICTVPGHEQAGMKATLTVG
jgi:uncharacterized cupredoxin-like copper-binding protein